LIDKIDVDNWTIDDIEEPKDFQINPPSLDAKQAHILKKKQDLNVVFRSLLIEDGIMEIPLCCMIFMQVVRLALTNDILKLGDFYSSYHPRLYFFWGGLMSALLMSPQIEEMVGMIIGKLLMKILKKNYNPNLPC
jgi:hypothetical protein